MPIVCRWPVHDGFAGTLSLSELENGVSRLGTRMERRTKTEDSVFVDSSSQL
jgi:hypothetical protein